jgi:thioredoxin-like negative regulator of GroEL
MDRDKVRKSGPRGLRGWWLIGLLGLFATILLACWGVRALDDRRRRTRIEVARKALAARAYEDARARLIEAASSWPMDDEVNRLLGSAEAALGHKEAARAAWARVPAHSRFGPEANLFQARMALEDHQWAVAEEPLKRALRGPETIGEEAFVSLVYLLRLEGRFQEARALVVEAWDTYPDTLGLLRELDRFDSVNPIPVEEVRMRLDEAQNAAPGDDRVWLGRANLAIRVGEFELAARLLGDCLGRRQSDAAAWSSKLGLAQATFDVDGARAALAHLPEAAVTDLDVLSLRAWFARSAGDTAGERKALTMLIDRHPGNLRSFERLAELVLADGDEPGAARLRERRAYLARIKSQYEEALQSMEVTGSEEQMAAWAEELGRRFEARAWWLLSRARDPRRDAPERALARMERVPPAPRPRLTELLAELDSLPSSKVRPSSDPGSISIAFEDEAEEAGLLFVFENGRSPQAQMPETMSGGVAILDFDGDGWLDVYCVQGGHFPQAPGSSTCRDRLFHNRGDGTFEDVSESSGISSMPGGYGHGVAVGDYDNDGHPDLFVTRWRSYALYRNLGNGAFEDVTERSCLDGDRDWPTSAAFADLDGDGDLDLYVCHYLVWDESNSRTCRLWPLGPIDYCPPYSFPSCPDHLFRNDNGTFVDVTDESGIVDRSGQGLGVVAADLDDDRKIDLFVANDQSANFLFHNLGGLRFEEVGGPSGVASNADGTFQAGMGVTLGDLDGDGWPDLAVTNFYNEGTTLYHGLGKGLFADWSDATGVLRASRFLLGFGVSFLDADNDGWLDLASTNGHVNHDPRWAPYAMPAQLLRGGPDGRLHDVSDHAGPPWKVPRVGRGLAIGDLDHDGRVDLLVVPQDGRLAYFHNRSAPRHWLVLALEGTSPGRDAIGAKVVVRAGGRTQTGWRVGGGSYQSASSPRLHFGLGDATSVDEVVVTWPSGRVDRFPSLAIDTAHLIREGYAWSRPLAGPAAERRRGGTAP